MNVGQYFIVAATIIGLFFKTGFWPQVVAFLTQVGGALEAGGGTVGPITIGNDTLTVTIAPKG